MSVAVISSVGVSVCVGVVILVTDGVASSESVGGGVGRCVIVSVVGIEWVGVTGGVGGGVMVVVTACESVVVNVLKLVDLDDGIVDEGVGVIGRDLLIVLADTV